MPHILPTPEAGAAFFGNPPAGPVFMLNLLKFRETADYVESPDLAPPEPISGMEAYRRYGQGVRPLLEEVGGEVTFQGGAGPWLIGPAAEGFDLALIVRWPSAATLLAVAESDAYRAIQGHRTAALADSRLLPMTPQG